MPELPEVETTRRGVAPHVVGRRIARAHVYDPRLRWPVPADLAERVSRAARSTRVDRRSKYLLFRLGDGHAAGAFRHDGKPAASTASPPPRRPHDHVDLVLDDGTLLRYHDPRRFGAMLWIAGRQTTIRCSRASAPSRSTRRSTRATCGEALRTRTRRDQARADGQRASSSASGTSTPTKRCSAPASGPTTPARKVSRPRLARLVDAVRDVLAEAIAKGGSTLRDYVDARGEPGYFQLDYFVYGREGEPCRVCRHADPHAPAGRARVVLLPAAASDVGRPDLRAAAALRAAARRSDAAVGTVAVPCTLRDQPRARHPAAAPAA